MTERDGPKVILCQRLADELYSADEPPVISAQALAETFHLLVRKAGLSRAEAALRLNRIRNLASVVATDETVLDAAMDLAVSHALQIYDAIILAAAASSGCDLLLSEDMQDGFRWKGVTVRNPFTPPY